VAEPRTPAVPGTPAVAAASEGAARPRVLVAGVVTRRRGPALELLAALVRDGGSAVLVAADGRPPVSVPAGVEVIDLSPAESRLPTRVRRSRPYKAVRGWVMWQALRRQLDAVRISELDHVILVDIQSWPIAWQLNRRNRAITIGWDVPDELFERVGRARPAPPRPEPQPDRA